MANGVTTERADMLSASLPYRIMHELQIPVYEQIRETDSDFYERLEAAGFLLDWGEDGSGLIMKYLRRGSGYYIDVGASDLVARGEIKLQVGTVDHLTEDAVVMTDGTELPADLIVYATGYGSMNGWVADLVSPEVADKVGQGLGPRVRTRRRTLAHGRASSATCGSRPSRRRCGSTAGTCPVALLLAVPRPAAQGAGGGHRHPGVRAAGGPPPAVSYSRVGSRLRLERLEGGLKALELVAQGPGSR